MMLPSLTIKHCDESLILLLCMRAYKPADEGSSSEIHYSQLSESHFLKITFASCWELFALMGTPLRAVWRL